MAGYFGIPPDKLHIVPLGIDIRDFESSRRTPCAVCQTRQLENGEPENGTSTDRPDRSQSCFPTRPPAVGYLARLAPEKGLHVLVDAFLELRRMAGMDNVQLHIAGWLGEHHRPYAESQFAKLRSAGLSDAFQFIGEVDRRGKAEFLRTIDLMSVPATHREPKGLFVLESLAAGVPVVLPNHGAFPELIASTGGGCLTPPHDPNALAGAIADLLRDEPRRRQHAAAGRQAVLEHRHAEAMARATLEVFQMFAGAVR
jgi:glycosyltransferase involved in cell wall biosynthesis